MKVFFFFFLGKLLITQQAYRNKSSRSGAQMVTFEMSAPAAPCDISIVDL